MLMRTAPVAKKRRRQDTCRCKAYKFPHRLGSGKCVGDESGPFCGHCGMPCCATAVDNGIGAYEYWGQKGVHKQIDIESDCCNASVFENANLTINYEGGAD